MLVCRRQLALWPAGAMEVGVRCRSSVHVQGGVLPVLPVLPVHTVLPLLPVACG